jgi:hypothetical protein
LAGFAPKAGSEVEQKAERLEGKPMHCLWPFQPFRLSAFFQKPAFPTLGAMPA